MSLVQIPFAITSQNLSLERLRFNLQFCSLALLGFDYMLTLSDEIEYIWKERWRISTLLYFLCRYALISNTVFLFLIIRDGDTTRVHNEGGYILCAVLGIFGRIGILVVWGLRTFAICGKSIKVLVVLGCFAIACVIASIVHVVFLKYQTSNDITMYVTIGGTIASLMFAFELTAFILATARVWMAAKETRTDPFGRKNSVQSLLFRQGLQYIIAVVVLSTASICMNFNGWVNHTNPGFFQRLLNCLKLPLPAFLTARFILRLRKWDRHRREMDHLTMFSSVSPPNASGAANSFQSLNIPLASPIAVDGPGPPLNSPRRRGSSKAPVPAAIVRTPIEDFSILQELGADIGPKPLSKDLESWFENYEWEWERMDSDEVLRRWKSAAEGGDLSPSSSTTPIVTGVGSGFSSPRRNLKDVENGFGLTL